MTEQQRPDTGAISRDAVQIARDYSGRGPTYAKATVEDDVVTVLLANALTKAERTIAEAGDPDAVLAHRSAIQDVMRDSLVAMVEDHTERKVIAFMSDNHIDPDYGVEVFVLEPGEAA